MPLTGRRRTNGSSSRSNREGRKDIEEKTPQGSFRGVFCENVEDGNNGKGTRKSLQQRGREKKDKGLGSWGGRHKGDGQSTEKGGGSFPFTKLKLSGAPRLERLSGRQVGHWRNEVSSLPDQSNGTGGRMRIPSQV